MIILHPTAYLVIAAIKSLQHYTPEWDREVDKWIRKDENSFYKFKEDVFNTIEKNMHQLNSDGFEKL